MATYVQSAWSGIVRRVVGKPGGDALAHGSVSSAIEEYDRMFAEDKDTMGVDKKKIDARKDTYAKLVNHYYDLATDFYEYGWGQSFHFAPRYQGETFEASIARHEHYLALRLGLKKGQTVLDVGCGVGGPMRAIARFSGANVVGVNNNAYQVSRCNTLCEKQNLAHLSKAVKGDFMNLPFPAESFDACYAIEATCHAPDRVGCFSQMFKVLKEGGVFAGYEWVMTPKYDPKNEEHRRVKHMVEHGDGLPDLAMADDVISALKKAGFEVEEHFDVAVTAPADGNEISWYASLQGSCSLSQFKHTRAGRRCTQALVDVMETLHLAPKGTSQTHKMLCVGGDGLAKGGEWGIFTPMYFFIARKPVKSKKAKEPKA